MRDFDVVKKRFENIYDRVKGMTAGRRAELSFMPLLKKHDRDKWGVAVCSVDGQRILLGDVHEKFCVQACAKPILYCIALEENGFQRVNKHIGREPSGRPVNELILDRRTTPAIPHNPFVNAGSLMACALVQADLPDAGTRLQFCLRKYWEPLNGNRGECTYNHENYEMESATADRNRCLMYVGVISEP